MKNVGLPPFVSILPYFGSHDAAFPGESFWEQVVQGVEPRGNGWPTSHGELTRSRRRHAAFHCPAPLHWALVHSRWQRRRRSGLRVSIRLRGSPAPRLRRIPIRYRLMTDSRQVRGAVCRATDSSALSSFDPCRRNSISNFKQAKDRLAQKLQSQDLRLGPFVEEPTTFIEASRECRRPRY